MILKKKMKTKKKEGGVGAEKNAEEEEEEVEDKKGNAISPLIMDSWTGMEAFDGSWTGQM